MEFEEEELTPETFKDATLEMKFLYFSHSIKFRLDDIQTLLMLLIIYYNKLDYQNDELGAQIDELWNRLRQTIKYNNMLMRLIKEEIYSPK